MCFKPWSRGLIALLLVFATTRCGLHFGEKQPEPPAPSYSGRGLSCVGQIPRNAELYVRDELSVEEINTFVLCIEKAFTSFAQLTRGRDHHSTYTPDEIRDFLHEYFMKSNRINDELMHEFMVIKQALVGGAPDRITRRELYVAVEVLEDLRQEAIRLKPYIKYLNPDLAEKQGEDESFGEHLAEANDALNMAIRTFSSRLRKSKSVYPISNLSNFLKEFRDFVKWKDHFPHAKPAPDWVQFLRIFKELTVGVSTTDSIQPDEWNRLLQASARWYLSYLQFRVGIKGKVIFQQQGLQNAELLAREIFAQVKEAIGQQTETKAILFSQIFRLVGALEALQWLPEGVKRKHAEAAIEAFVSKMFGPANEAPSARRSRGLTVEALTLMENEFFSWSAIQWKIIAQHPQPLDLQVHIPNLLQNKVLIPFVLRVPTSSYPDSNWVEFLKLKDQDLVVPLYYDKCDNRLAAERDPECSNGVRRPQLFKTWILSSWERTLSGIKADSFHQLSMMNLIRSLSKLIIRGYSNDQTLRQGWSAGVLKKEMQAFYMDFRALGIDLRFFDPRNCKTGERSFLEGKLFTYAAKGFGEGGDGDTSLLTLPEMIEFLAFLYSGGSMGDEIYTDLKKVCQVDPKLNDKGKVEIPLDVQGHELLKRDCVVQNLPTVILDHIGHMPQFKKYYEHLAPSDRARYMLNQLQTAYSPNSVPESVEHSELAMVAVIMQYAEAVMTRYDADSDGVLTRNEALAAFPVFGGYINQFVQESKGVLLWSQATRNVFLSLLTYKQIPGFGGVIEPGTFLKPGTIALDRLELSEVFKVILRKLFDKEVPSASRVCGAASTVSENPLNLPDSK